MAGNPAIVTDDLVKVYRLGVGRRSVTALDGVSFSVPAGVIFAFLGLNGAGKTTTIKLLLDHARPTRGSATLFGVDTRRPEARRRVGYMPDLPHFYRFLTARELLDYTGRLFTMPRPQRRSRAEELLRRVGLQDRGDESLRGFSRGMLQRIGLAQALVNDPELVILDEPLAGLDPVGRVELRELIAEVRREGRTVFFSSHLLDDAQRLADFVGIIHRGRMVASGRLEDLLRRSPGWEAEIEVTGNEWEPTLRRMGWQVVKSDGRRVRVVIADEKTLPHFYRLAGKGEVRVESLTPRRMDLEEAFMEELGKGVGGDDRR